MRVENILRGPDEAVNQERIKVVLRAADELGIRMLPAGANLTAAERNAAPDTVFMDAHGFAMSWLSDAARTFVGYEQDGKACAFAHLIYGRQYNEPVISASVMVLQAKTPEQRQIMLKILAGHAQLLGASAMLFEGKDGDVFPSEPVPLRIHKIG